MIGEGDQFPGFSLLDQNGNSHTLSEMKGKRFVVYVYPKDDTPGCTIQGKGFTAAKQKYDAEDITVFGLSADDVSSHRSFCDKYAFAHTLLADPEEKLLTALGVEKGEWKGHVFWKRTTFLVNSAGTVAKVYTNVDPENHEQIILQDFLKL